MLEGKKEMKEMSDDRLEIELDSEASTDGLVALLESTIEGIKPRKGKRFRVSLRIKEKVSE